MELGSIIDCIDDYGKIEIEGLAFCDKEVSKNYLYFCLSGANSDGHNYAESAIEYGAVALVVERRLDLDIPQIVVENARSVMSFCASAFYDNPHKKLKMVAITGTNGKTTTSYYVREILLAANKKVGVIGTNAIMIGEKRIEATLTTPDCIELQRTLKEMVDAKIEYVVMEASAHALALNKLDGIMFDVAAFTNLSQDHLDFFGDMEKYFLAKQRLFTRCRFAIINIDDEYGIRLAKSSIVPYAGFGCYNPADVFAMDFSQTVNGLSYILNASDDIAAISSKLTGKFNMYNSLCAAAIAKALNISIRDISKGIRNLVSVDGRYNIIQTPKGSVVIDFAHTEDGLRNVLLSTQELTKNKIITVFGCGGNRDSTKRPIMGSVAGQLSDFCIITSDNPRYEKADEIMSEIELGFKKIGKNNYTLEPDRKKAIEIGYNMLRKGDVLIIAGKGAENYQEIKGVKYPYSDKEFISELISKNA